MIHLDLLPSIIIVWLTALIIVLLGIKMFLKQGILYRRIGFGLFSIATALILNGIFDLYFLFTTYYWIIVEFFHILGAILITLAVLSSKKTKKEKKDESIYKFGGENLEK